MSDEASDGVGIEEVGRAGEVSPVLGLDVGDRRIGLALTDRLGISAQPLLTVHRTTLRADLKSIGRVVRRHGVREVVIGLPLHSSGEMSAQATKTQAFAAALTEAMPELRVHWMDERLTTAEAHGLLDSSRGRRDGALARKERSGVVDQVAAVLLLEAFLSMRSPRLLPMPPEDEDAAEGTTE